MAEVHRLRTLQVRVAGHRPVEVLLGAAQQARHQLTDRSLRHARALARVQREVGHHLVVARARGMQLAADRAHELGQAPLDRHVDIFISFN